MTEQPARPYIGGQAVIEGVMMRSPSSFAIVCRRRSGELVVREQPMAAPVAKGPRSWPLLRGLATVVESLRLGSRSLRWSAEIYEQDLEAEAAAEEAAGKAKAGKGASISAAMALSVAALATLDVEEPAVKPASPHPPTEKPVSAAVTAAAETAGPVPVPLPLHDEKKKGAGVLGVLPILFAVFLFVALPQAGAEGINKLFDLGLEVTSPGFQAITGASKLLIVVGYLLGIRQISEVRRVFQYHGAEHKAISTYEAREALEVENARRQTTLHPRCGTTFLVMVALVSILVFSMVGAFLPKIPGGRVVESLGFFLMKLPFLPIIAAFTYELQRFFARHCTVGPLRALLWPGFLVQKITTAEPEDAQLEIALASLRATLWREEAVAAPVQPDRTFASYGEMLTDPGYAAARA